MSRRARLAAVLFATAGVAYAADRVTKVWAEGRLQGRAPIEIVPGVLELRYTENPGGAFGLFGGQPWLFFGATLLVALVIVGTSFRQESRLNAVALGLILGGAFGNLTDRIVRGPGVSGRVVDFIELTDLWPVFNVADSSIVVGAILLVLSGLGGRSTEEG